MKHLKIFETNTLFEAARAALNLPNVSLVEENYGIQFLPYVEQDPYNGHDYSQDYLTLIAIDDCDFNVVPFNGGISYSLDGGETWSEEVGELSNPISVNAGDRVLLKGSYGSITPEETSGDEYGGGYGEYGSGYGYDETTAVSRISSTGRYSVEGNIMSLVYGDNFVGQTSLANLNNVFEKLFAMTEDDYSYETYDYDSKIISAENLSLPATTLSDYCYANMFYGCNTLTAAPVLSATTLADHCYEQMFYGCESLTTLPQLLATTLSDYCYANMFENCESITSVPFDYLPVTTLTDHCYSNMFSGSSLANLPQLPATTLANYCYENMFLNCNITSIPSNYLPATTLAESCYEQMFGGNTGITQLPTLPATTLATNCYSSMFYRTGITSIPSNYLPVTTLAEGCYRSMFSSCSSLTSIPSGLLPATTLAKGCYNYMFSGCSNLVSVPSNLLPATTLTSYCYNQMFYECTALTTAPELPATALAPNCYMNMFNGCTSLTTSPTLSATALVDYCYASMFKNCISLTSITCLAETGFNLSSWTYPLNDWVSGVAASGTFTKSSNASDWQNGTSGIPSGWTVQNAS